MSLNHIQLGDAAITELYRDKLMASESKASGPWQTLAATSPSTPSIPEPAKTSSPVPPTKTPPAPTIPAPAPATPSPAAAKTASSKPAPTETFQAPGAAAAAPPPALSGYKILGNNRRNISIIVDARGIAFLPDDQLTVLTRMLEACKMNLGDVAIVNHAAAPVVIGTLREQLHPRTVLIFGPKPPEIGLPMDFPVFKILSYDQCTYLTAPFLADMVVPGEESKALKTKLWASLKTLFEI